jgi:DNA-directed RNA polymerase subunit RPC12/RpoP
MTEDYPKLQFEGKDYFMVGCANCDECKWFVYADGKDFVAKCSNCGHKIVMKQDSLRDKPNQKAIDMRFFT